MCFINDFNNNIMCYNLSPNSIKKKVAHRGKVGETTTLWVDHWFGNCN